VTTNSDIRTSRDTSVMDASEGPQEHDEREQRIEALLVPVLGQLEERPFYSLELLSTLKADQDDLKEAFIRAEAGGLIHCADPGDGSRPAITDSGRAFLAASH
jgi:hypothetical protein